MSDRRASIWKRNRRCCHRQRRRTRHRLHFVFLIFFFFDIIRFDNDSSCFGNQMSAIRIRRHVLDIYFYFLFSSLVHSILVFFYRWRAETTSSIWLRQTHMIVATASAVATAVASWLSQFDDIEVVVHLELPFWRRRYRIIFNMSYTQCSRNEFDETKTLLFAWCQTRSHTWCLILATSTSISCEIKATR